jgi:hypothetical protein
VKQGDRVVQNYQSNVPYRRVVILREAKKAFSTGNQNLLKGGIGAKNYQVVNAFFISFAHIM